jgi:hypothetical protein
LGELERFLDRDRDSMRIRLLESQARFGEEGRTLPGSIESAWVFSRRVLRAAKRNQDGVRVLKKEKEKKFSRAELLSLDRAGLMGVRHQVHVRLRHVLMSA